MESRKSLSPVLCFPVLLALLLAVPSVQADEPAGEPAAEQQMPATPDRYAIPEGGADMLIGFVERTLMNMPADQQEREKAMAAANEAADRALAGEMTDEQLGKVVSLKTFLLRDEPEKLKALAEKLAADGHSESARQVQAVLIMLEMRAIGRLAPDQREPAAEKVIAKIIEFLSAGSFGVSEVRLGLSASQVAQQIGNDTLAVEVFRKMQQRAAESENPRIRPLAEALEGSIRRLTLVGKPMELKGDTLAGEPFDWSAYAGKTVLVDFWATWCGPCLAEIPKLKRLYDAYHEKGFDIVGISLDRSREDLESYLKEQPLPWTILYDGEGRHPMAEYYGVMGIPQMILVGSDGKVLSIHARGPELEKLLEERFGPLPEPAAENE